jgi:hypothetical protein
MILSPKTPVRVTPGARKRRGSRGSPELRFNALSGARTHHDLVIIGSVNAAWARARDFTRYGARRSLTELAVLTPQPAVLLPLRCRQDAVAAARIAFPLRQPIPDGDRTQLGVEAHLARCFGTAVCELVPLQLRLVQECAREQPYRDWNAGPRPTELRRVLAARCRYLSGFNVSVSRSACLTSVDRSKIAKQI